MGWWKYRFSESILTVLVFSKIYINFSLYIADWQLFCGPILRLINEKSLLLNMKNLASIIVAFAEQHFTTGAIFVAKKILSVSKNLVRCLSQKDIDVYIDAILALQSSSTSPPLPPPHGVYLDGNVCKSNHIPVNAPSAMPHANWLEGQQLFETKRLAVYN